MYVCMHVCVCVCVRARVCIHLRLQFAPRQGQSGAPPATCAGAYETYGAPHIGGCCPLRATPTAPGTLARAGGVKHATGPPAPALCLRGVSRSQGGGGWLSKTCMYSSSLQVFFFPSNPTCLRQASCDFHLKTQEGVHTGS